MLQGCAPAVHTFVLHCESSRSQSYTISRMAAPEIDRYAIAAELFKDQPSGFPIDSDLDLRQIVLPEDDDMGINSDDEADGEEVETESGFGSIIGTRTRACCVDRSPLT